MYPHGVMNFFVTKIALREANLRALLHCNIFIAFRMFPLIQSGMYLIVE